jgi:hypothetical protein
MKPFLLSNSFPFSLIRRRLIVEPRHESDLITLMHQRPWVSAWGHENTLALASSIVGHDLRPSTQRPALTLDAHQLPLLDGQSFDEAWLLSPTFVPGFRPAIGQEPTPADIQHWQVLQLRWADTTDS